jgi:hypothetical protein
LALVILVFIDLSLLPLVTVGVVAGSIVTAGNHSSPTAAAIAIAVLMWVILVAGTFAVGRAWHRAPRPGHPTSN